MWLLAMCLKLNSIFTLKQLPPEVHGYSASPDAQAKILLSSLTFLFLSHPCPSPSLWQILPHCAHSSHWPRPVISSSDHCTRLLSVCPTARDQHSLWGHPHLTVAPVHRALCGSALWSVKTVRGSKSTRPLVIRPLPPLRYNLLLLSHCSLIGL